MDKMWAGRFQKSTDKLADEFNSSISVDQRMYREDIMGSMAHATMLGAQNIIPMEDAEKMIEALELILSDIESGKLPIDSSCEDIHMFIEAELTRREGDLGKKLHTARSRNDQVALDFRLYMKKESQEIVLLIKELLKALADLAEEYSDTIMPGYTHLQRAQPVTFGHHLLAYAMMMIRDVDRMNDAVKRMDYSPLGSCALAGTTYDTDRDLVAEKLGLSGITQNSLDSVSDRDFAAELSGAYAITMMHLSRFSEEIIMWSSWEFKFIELDDAFSTGSSIMPQKKNPDMAELVRGKTGRVYGNLISILTTLKGLPLAYNKDMQEDKEGVFDSIDTLKSCVMIFTPMLKSMAVNKENMRKAAGRGFINATDCADYLVKKGLPFRSAYKITGQLVAECIKEHVTLEDLPLESYRQLSPLFEEDLYDEISLDACTQKRTSKGGPSKESVLAQVKYVRSFCN